jgi:D-glycero-D-manno-heptose 1,7-bisphosphate phosphatase
MKMVILGRDGVINKSREKGILEPDEWEAIAGSLEAIASLNQAGYRVICATNQSQISTGNLKMDKLNAIHQKMQRELEKVGGHIDALFFCPHDPGSGCDCRKPNPGMLTQAAERFYTSTDDIVLIGDDAVDLEAAKKAGIGSCLVLTGNGTTSRDSLKVADDINIYSDLAEATEALLENG